jgi:hypothetical protein
LHVQFLGPTYYGRSNALDPSRCINLYPEINPNPAGKAQISLVGTPGTSVLFDCGAAPVRALYVFGGVLYAVAGDQFISWIAGNVTVLGTLATTTGNVYIADNGISIAGVGGNQMMIVDGVEGYMWNVGTNTFTTLSLPASPNSLAYSGGYFIISCGTRMSVYVSNLYDCSTWSGLAVGNAIQSTSDVVALAAYDQLLMIFKSDSAEPWYDAGTPPTSLGCPFAFYSGMPINYGVVAAGSVAQGGDYLYALGGDGSGVDVIGFSGYTPTKLLPPALSYRINQMPVVSDAIGFTYSDSGHDFYVLSFPTGNATFVFDSTTKMWHERSTYAATADRRSPNRHLANCYTYYNGQHLVGDYRTGAVAVMRNTVYTDLGSPLIRTRIAPILPDKQDRRDLFFYEFEVEAEVGVMQGVTATDPTTGGPLTPQASLSWSIDGGVTWSNEYIVSMGAVGQTMTRIVWRRVGYSFNMVFDLTISDPVPVVLVDTFADVSE